MLAAASCTHASGCIFFLIIHVNYGSPSITCALLCCTQGVTPIMNIKGTRGRGAKMDCDAGWIPKRYTLGEGWKGKASGKEKNYDVGWYQSKGYITKDEGKSSRQEKRVLTYNECVPVVQCATMYYTMSDRIFLNPLTFCRKIHNFDSVWTNHWLA